MASMVHLGRRVATVGRSAIVQRLLGEFLREVAVLVVVFAPLESLLQGRPLTLGFLAVIIGLVVVPLAIGIFLEVNAS